MQSNIATDNLYHQIVKRKLETTFDLDVLINIVQYEKLFPTISKIENALHKQYPDLIIFHIRTEQIQRMIKFYFKYHDKNGNLKKKFNIALLGVVNPEKQNCNLYHQSTIMNDPTKFKSNSFLINLNYLAGYLFLNQFFAFRIYKKLITQIIKLASDKSINILFTGPVSRPTSVIENATSIFLNHYMESFIIDDMKKSYLNLLGSYVNQKYLFCEDNVCVNELGHNRIAGLLFKYFEENYSLKKILYQY
ncbi:MAG: hypothetical protein ABI638_14365 [Ignavibacteriota bacterium]